MSHILKRELAAEPGFDPGGASLDGLRVIINNDQTVLNLVAGAGFEPTTFGL